MHPLLVRFFHYLQYELNRAPLTVESYRNDISQFQEWLCAGNPDAVDFVSVTSSDVRAWLAYQAKKGDIPRTLRRKVISLRTLFKWMVKSELIKKSPLLEVPLPKIPKPLPDFIKPEEVENALSKLNEHEDAETCGGMLSRVVVELLYSLGIRRAELAGINDEDVSFSKKEIKVTGKRSKQRIVPVPDSLLEKIREWQCIRNVEQPREESERALLTINGKRITHNQIYRIVRGALQDSTARKKSPHALRHTFASGMLNGGAEIDSVREFLGHASLATTQIYTHISLNEIKKAYTTAHPRSNDSKK